MPPPFPFWKRAIDILGALVALPLLPAVVIFAACLIKPRAAGPILFRQLRIGHKGRPFVMYKVRTMAASCDTDPHRLYFEDVVQQGKPLEKLDQAGDSRLCSAARMLRASGFDELPQIINVLRGDMSLVGPRPCLPYEYRFFQPKHQNRFLLRPGLTGLWQVTAKDTATFEEMVRLDIEYGRRVSLRTDAWILFKTVPTVLGQIRKFFTHAPFTPVPAAASASSQVEKTTAVS